MKTRCLVLLLLASILKSPLRLLCHRKLLWLVCSTLSISCMHDKEEVLHFFFFFFSRCSVVKILGLAVSGAVQMWAQQLKNFAFLCGLSLIVEGGEQQTRGTRMARVLRLCCGTLVTVMALYVAACFALFPLLTRQPRPRIILADDDPILASFFDSGPSCAKSDAVVSSAGKSFDSEAGKKGKQHPPMYHSFSVYCAPIVLIPFPAGNCLSIESCGVYILREWLVVFSLYGAWRKLWRSLLLVHRLKKAVKIFFCLYIAWRKLWRIIFCLYVAWRKLWRIFFCLYIAWRKLWRVFSCLYVAWRKLWRIFLLAW